MAAEGADSLAIQRNAEEPVELSDPERHVGVGGQDRATQKPAQPVQDALFRPERGPNLRPPCEDLGDILPPVRSGRALLLQASTETGF